MRKTYPTTEQLAVSADLGAGVITVTAADVTETVVEVDGPRAEEFDVRLEGGRLSVRAPHSRFFGHGDAHEVRLAVPTGSDLSTRTGSADLRVDGTVGRVHVKTGSGLVAIEHAAGVAVFESGSGDIHAGRLDSDVRVKSGSGDVRVDEIGGKVSMSTGSGDVLIGNALSDTDLKTGSGDLEVKWSRADVNLFTASGDVVLGHVPQGRITARNMSGDVSVAIPAGTPVWTDINTVTGQVRSDLAGTGKPAEGQPYVELRASTVSGDVTLTQV